MGNKILRVCLRPGCTKLTTDGYCDEHKPKRKPDNRDSAYRRGYNSAWRMAREGYLIKHPFCVECLKHGRHTKATVVDHIIPHKGNKNLFWDNDNWQPLCAECHNRKTAREDGGFGHPVKNK